MSRPFETCKNKRLKWYVRVITDEDTSQETLSVTNTEIRMHLQMVAPEIKLHSITFVHKLVLEEAALRFAALADDCGVDMLADEPESLRGVTIEGEEGKTFEVQPNPPAPTLEQRIEYLEAALINSDVRITRLFREKEDKSGPSDY